MKILITGGAGYIGSHTIIDLIEQYPNCEIISIDNFMNSSNKTFDRIKEITGKKIKNYNEDLNNIKRIEKIFKKHTFEGVIHFAALKSVSESVEKPILYYQNNLNALINILYCCEKYNCRNIIFSSSCSVYGNTTELPVTEKTPLQSAASPYAHTKQLGEEILASFLSLKNKFSGISLRYFNPVGAHPSGLNGEEPIQIPSNLIPFITQTAAGIRDCLTIFGKDYPTKDGTCIRDYIHIMDLANAHTKALNYLLAGKQTQNYQVFNVGTGEGTSVLEAVQFFEKITNQKLNYTFSQRRPGDVIAVYADNRLIQKELNWKASYSIEDMLSSAWEWQKRLMMKKNKKK